MTQAIPETRIDGVLMSNRYAALSKGIPFSLVHVCFRMWEKHAFPNISSNHPILPPSQFPNENDHFVEVGYHPQTKTIVTRGVRRENNLQSKTLQKIGELFSKVLANLLAEESFNGFDSVDKEHCEKALQFDLSDYEFCRYVELSESLLDSSTIVMKRAMQQMLEGQPILFRVEFRVKEDGEESSGGLEIASDSDGFFPSLKLREFTSEGDMKYRKIVELCCRVVQDKLKCFLEIGDFEDKVKRCCQAVQLFVKGNSWSFQQEVHKIAKTFPS